MNDAPHDAPASTPPSPGRPRRVFAAIADLCAVILAGACSAALPADPQPAAPAATTAKAQRGVAEHPESAVAREAAAPPVDGSPTPSAPLAKTSSKPAPCPKEMAHVRDSGVDVCVDRWEASLVRVDASGAESVWPDNQPVDDVEGDVMAVSRPGVMPQGYISQRQAARACARAGKRLCSLREWRAACTGPEHRRYPYGNTRHAGTCNDYDPGTRPHPVAKLFNASAPPGTPRSEMWGTKWMNDPRLHGADSGLRPTGASANCTNEYGVYDMVGNLHEWIDDPKGSFAGGFFMDTRINGEGCAYLTTAHAPTYHDYSTGFRCCADVPQ